MPEHHLDVLESRQDRRMGLLTLGLSALALLVGLGLESVVALFLGGAGLLIGLWAVLDRRLKLRVDDVGIWHAPWGITVQWGEIEAIETRTLRGVEQVCLVPKSPSLLLERMSPWGRFTTWMTARAWSSRFVLSTAGLEHGTPALLHILRRYHEARTGPTQP